MNKPIITIDIESIKQAKANMERKIASALTDFYKATDLTVERINIDYSTHSHSDGNKTVRDLIVYTGIKCVVENPLMKDF